MLGEYLRRHGSRIHCALAFWVGQVTRCRLDRPRRDRERKQAARGSLSPVATQTARKHFTAERMMLSRPSVVRRIFSDDLLNGTSVEPKNVVSAFTVP